MANIDENANPQSQVLLQLVKDLGIDTLSEDKQNDLIVKMTEILLKRIFLETMEKLGEKGREEYIEMTEEGNEMAPEQIEAFFKEKIENYDKMVEEVVLEFKEEMTTTNNSQQAVTNNQ